MDIYYLFIAIVAVMILVVLISIAIGLASLQRETREMKYEIVRLRQDFEIAKNEFNEEYQSRVREAFDDIKESKDYLNSLNEIMTIIEKYELPDLQKEKF